MFKRMFFSISSKVGLVWTFRVEIFKRRKDNVKGRKGEREEGSIWDGSDQNEGKQGVWEEERKVRVCVCGLAE